MPVEPLVLRIENGVSRYHKAVKFLGLLLFFFLLIVITYPKLLPNFSTMAPRADSDDMHYIVSIINYSLNSPLREIYHLPFYYPTPFITTFGHPLFGISLVFKIFQVCRLNFYQSYNLYIIFGLLLGTWGCYLLAREISGSPLFSLAFSVFYIFFDRNYLHFAWLNFFSHACLPFIFYFFIRYMRSGKQVHLLAGIFFAFSQFVASIYYGFYLWVFILPFFLAFSLAVKLCDRGKFIRILIGLAVAFGMLLLIYHPFLTNAKPERAFNAKWLLAPDSFFNSAKILFNMHVLDLGKYSFQKGYRFIPGYTFNFFTLLFFAVFLDRNRKKHFTLLCALFFIANLTFFENGHFFEFSFLVLVIFLAYLAWRSWPAMESRVKTILLTLSASILILFHFEKLPILNEISLYEFFIHLRILPGPSGLRNVDRLIPLCTPLLIAIAATAAATLATTLNFSKIRSTIFAMAIMMLLFMENYSFFQEKMMRPLPLSSIYRQIPFRQGKIILELPFYDRRSKPVRASRETRVYMVNWVQHQNYLLNGWTSFLPKQYFLDLQKNVPCFDATFPSESHLKKLIANYSLTHIVFHWNRLGALKYRMRANLAKINKYGKIIYQDPGSTILGVQEYMPVTRLTRTFSYAHLRWHKITIILKHPYDKSIQLFLNNKPSSRIYAQGKQIVLNMQKEKLALAKNRIDIHFDQEIQLDELVIL